MKRDSKKLAKLTWFPRPLLHTALICLLLAFLLPVLLLRPAKGAGGKPSELIKAVKSTTNRETSADATSPARAEDTAEDSSGKLLTVQIDGENQQMTLSDYLWGVVAAEMPAAFEQEALNAQAIAARTYVMYRMEHPSSQHPDADICADPGCCQAWMSTEDRMAAWSKKSAKTYADKITKAVDSTQGQVLTYQGEPIFAAFHASSAGYTKSALEVWGEDFPYLQGVKSPEETDAIPNYYSTVKVSGEKFKEAVLSALPEADLSSANCEDWIGKERYDDLGLPESIKIGGKWVDTTVVRGWFELRSASFTVEVEEDTIVFYVTGYGHGVGMSQYGANALAKQGKTAEEILKWYYTGVEIDTLSEK